MGRAARVFSVSGVYHVVFRGVNQQSIFEEEEDYNKLIEDIEKVKNDMHFSIYGYCFMSNHVHMVVKENKDLEISVIMKRILTRYARWYNIKYGRSGALIANRYKSIPVEIDDYFLHLIRYVHQNPLKACLVEKLEDYKFSSYQEYTGESRLIDRELVDSLIDREGFIEYHKESEEMVFNVTDSMRKSDDELKLYLIKKFGITNPKDISKFEKERKIEILKELRNKYSDRQIQRVTDVPRGFVAKIEP